MKKAQVAASEASNSSYTIDHVLASAMATLLRAQPRDFKIVKQEWAAIRIQTVFRGFLVSFALYISILNLITCCL